MCVSSSLVKLESRLTVFETFLFVCRVKSVTGGCVLCLETEDVEAAIVKAVNAGAVKEGEIIEGEGACFSGLVGKVKDPYGFTWLICSPVKKCTDVEG